MKKATIVAEFIVIMTLVVGYFGLKVYCNNKEIDIRKQIMAEKDMYQQSFDKQYKVIAQLTEIAERNFEVNKQTFEEVYPLLFKERYQTKEGEILQKEATMKWIQESNPQWDMKAIQAGYDKIAEAVQAQREALYTQSEKLRDLVGERESLIEKFPGSWFISNKEKIEIVLITSKVTKETFATGEENDINLFNKK